MVGVPRKRTRRIRGTALYKSVPFFRLCIVLCALCGRARSVETGHVQPEEVETQQVGTESKSFHRN